MFGLGSNRSAAKDWKKLVEEDHPPFMTRSEKIRMGTLLVGLILVLTVFGMMGDIVERLGGVAPKPGGKVELTAAPAFEENEKLRATEAEWNAEWERMRREQGLPAARPGGDAAANDAERGPSGGAATATTSSATAAAGDGARAGASGAAGAAEGPGGAAADEATEVERQIAKAREEEWTRIEREFGLPEGFDRRALAPPIDHGLLGWVEDGTRERDRAPFYHLLRWVLSRTHEDIVRESSREVDLSWLRRDPDDLDARIANAKATRGKVLRLGAALMTEVWARPVEGEGAPKHWVYEAIVSDADRNVFYVIAADKTEELKDGDRVEVVGPFFKLLRVRTSDGKDRGFPTIVVRSLRKIEPDLRNPGLVWNPLINYVVGFALLALAVAIGLAWRGWRAPPPPPRKRPMIQNGKVRELDRSKAPGAPSADPAAPPPTAVSAPEPTSEPASASPLALAPAPDPAPASPDAEAPPAVAAAEARDAEASDDAARIDEAERPS